MGSAGVKSKNGRGGAQTVMEWLNQPPPDWDRANEHLLNFVCANAPLVPPALLTLLQENLTALVAFEESIRI